MEIDLDTLTVGHLARAFQVVHNVPKTAQLESALNESKVMKDVEDSQELIDVSCGESMSFHPCVSSFVLRSRLGTLPKLLCRMKGDNSPPLFELKVNVPECSDTVGIDVTVGSDSEINIRDVDPSTPLDELKDNIRAVASDTIEDKHLDALVDTAKKFVKAVNGAIVKSNKKLKEEREKFINELKLPIDLTGGVNSVLKQMFEHGYTLTVGQDQTAEVSDLLQGSFDYPMLVYAALFMAYHTSPRIDSKKRDKRFNGFVVNEDNFKGEILRRLGHMNGKDNKGSRMTYAKNIITFIRGYYIEQGQVPPIIAAVE